MEVGSTHIHFKHMYFQNEGGINMVKSVCNWQGFSVCPNQNLKTIFKKEKKKEKTKYNGNTW